MTSQGKGLIQHAEKVQEFFSTDQMFAVYVMQISDIVMLWK